MPLFKVSLTLETVVYAADVTDARYVAREGLEAAMDADLDVAYVERIDAVSSLPDEWTGESLVWHEGSGDLSVKDALANK